MFRYQYYPTYPDAKLKAFTVSFDDGITSDEKLCDLLRKYHAKGTFNINTGMFLEKAPDMPPQKGWRRMTSEEAVQLYGEDMEIAIHGEQHPFWDTMSGVHAMQDIVNDKRELERLTGRIIRGAASPYGAATDETIDILRLAGFAYCRSAVTTKSLSLKNVEPLRFQGTIHSRDPKTLELAQKFAASTTPRSRLLLFYVWGHTYEFMQDNNWDFIEEVLKTACDREDTWYCTSIELFDYLAAVRQLRWNTDQTMVQNPTSTDIWLRRSLAMRDSMPILPSIEAEFYCVPAGQTVSVPNE